MLSAAGPGDGRAAADSEPEQPTQVSSGRVAAAWRAGGRGRVPWRGAAVRAAAAAAGGGRLVLGRLVVAAGARGPAPARPVHHWHHGSRRPRQTNAGLRQKMSEYEELKTS